MKTWEEEHNTQVVPPEELGVLVEKLRAQGKTIVTVNGSFDVLHAGHLHQLFEAKQQGDVLICALNTDESIKTYKSEDRPIVPLKYRLQMISALRFVDYVTYFSETDPRTLLDTIRPDVHANGAEYGTDCIEAETVKKSGGRIHLVSKKDGLSTTALLEKIISTTLQKHGG